MTQLHSDALPVRAGPFAELPEAGMEPPGSTRALADDLRFVQRHLDAGGHLRRLDHVLVVYRHHGGQLSHGTPRSLLVKVRARAIERRVLSKWPRFSVWGAGRDGKAFVRALTAATARRIVAFAEVDAAKIGTVYEVEEASVRVPVVHFTQVVPPVVVCVARGRTGGELESNVRRMGLVEGENCWYFA